MRLKIIVELSIYQLKTLVQNENSILWKKIMPEKRYYKIYFILIRILFAIQISKSIIFPYKIEFYVFF